MNGNIIISDKQRLLEILAVVLTAVGKFIFMDYLDWRLPFVVIAILGWSAYVFFRYKQDNDILKYWGIRTDNLKIVVRFMLPFGLLAIFTFFIIGYYQKSINLTWHIIPILVTYPIWGSIQQFITIGLITGNLKDLKRKRLSKFSIIFITAVLFSVVHFPSQWLMLGTFILALFYGYVYLKMKNVFAMGLFHGWLGALFYYTVVNRDPFQEVFLKFIN